MVASNECSPMGRQRGRGWGQGYEEWHRGSRFCDCFQEQNASFGQKTLESDVIPRNRRSPMAKKCWIERNKRKQRTVKKFKDLRHKLKQEKDYVGLSMLPRDASPTRVVNRCEVTGRRRAFLRRFRLSRITFREMASAGLIPGVTKSSW